MRSFIKQCNGFGIKDIVSQQFEAARQIIDAGLVAPIIMSRKWIFIAR